MRWIGLTGGIASGKSTVTRLLRARALDVICADDLAREVVRPGTPGLAEVVAAFGPGAVLADGTLNRKQIGAAVFADRSRLQILEGIIHPRVRVLAQEKRREVGATGQKIGFYDVPLLYEKKMQADFSAVVVVACSVAIQKQRLILRDGFTEAEAERRIQAQLPLIEKVKQADYVIENEGTLPELEDKVDLFVKEILSYQAQE